MAKRLTYLQVHKNKGKLRRILPWWKTTNFVEFDLRKLSRFKDMKATPFIMFNGQKVEVGETVFIESLGGYCAVSS